MGPQKFRTVPNFGEFDEELLNVMVILKMTETQNRLIH